MKIPATVVIIAENEAKNIDFALRSIHDRFSDIVVVDAYSNDGTAQICANYPAVRVCQHAFENWAEQRNWALENCGISTDHVLFLDADEFLTEEFLSELAALFSSGKRFDAVAMMPEFIFMGKKLRFSYGHPLIRRLFRREGLHFVCEGARERAVSGPILLRFQVPFVHHDRKGLLFWLSKHLRNAEREAQFYGMRPVGAEYSADLKLRTWLRGYVWDRLPLLLRPFLYFFVRYVVRLGFLDGAAGFVYCFLHAFWYPMVIDLLILERRFKELV